MPSRERSPALGGSLLLVLACAAGCEIAEPELPTFTTTLTVPIGDERLQMLEIIEDESYLVVGEDASLSFLIEGEPQTIALDVDLEVDVEGSTVDAEIGPIALETANPTAFAFPLREVYPPAEAYDGGYLALPAFTFDLASPPSDLDGVTAASIAAGELAVMITNGLPLALGGAAEPERILVELVDPAGGGVLATVDFGMPIAPGTTAVGTAPLAGLDLPGTVAVRVTGGAMGSGGAPVSILAESLLQVLVELRDVTVTSCTAEVGPQSFSESLTTPLPDAYEVTLARIASGVMAFTVDNQMPIPCDALLTFAEIRDASMTPYAVAVSVPARTTRQVNVDLAGRSIRADGAPVTELTLSVDVASPGSGGVAVALDAADHLHAELAPALLRFDEVTGILPAETHALEPQTEAIDLPDELEGMSLVEASLILTLRNGTGMPADLALELSGTSAGGTARTLDIAAAVAPAAGRDYEETVIVLDHTNSGLVDFLNNLPETVTLSGDVLVGGPDVVGTIAPDADCRLDWRIEAPLLVSFDESSIEGDVDELDLDADTRDLIDEHAQGALVRTVVTNHLPFAVEIRILADTSPEVATDLLGLAPLSVPAGAVDPVTGLVSEATVSSPELTLSAAQARVFAQPGLHTKVEFTIPGTAAPVRVRSTDYLAVQGLVELAVLVGD